MAVQDIFNAILAYDEATVKAHTQAELDGGPDIATILNEGLIAPMDVVGERFSAGDLFIPEMLKAAQIMKMGLEILKPHLTAGQSQSKGTVVIGTVKGDLHDIGKNLVAMMLEGAGFEVVDLGVDVTSEAFVKAATEKNARVIGLSALLTTTMPYMKVVIDTMVEKGIRDDYIVMVGGAPLNEEFGKAVGADAYCRDAATAVEVAKQLVQERRKAG